MRKIVRIFYFLKLCPIYVDSALALRNIEAKELLEVLLDPVAIIINGPKNTEINEMIQEYVRRTIRKYKNRLLPEGFVRKSPFSTLTDLKPEFGVHWNTFTKSF